MTIGFSERFRRGIKAFARSALPCGLLLLQSTQYSVAQDSAEALAELQKKCVAAVQRAEKSVVAIARVSKEPGSAGFQVPNLGRMALNARLEESFPTDADFI